MVARRWHWCRALFYAFTISLSIGVDILQYSSPLSFLPQALEDEGHKAPQIASVIGSYYWAVFAGGACLMSYQLYRVVYRKPEALTWNHIRCHILGLIIGLAGGAVALIFEGLYPSLWVHFWARTVQGYLGAFLFFFAFLLSIELFEAQSVQQTLALTMSSMALHCAEAFGPFLGATIYTGFGPTVPYFALAGVSFCNQCLLLVLLFTLPSADPEGADPEAVPLLVADDSQIEYSGWSEVKAIFSSAMLWRSVLVIAPAAMVKASLESILPLFTDHKLHYDEFQVGICFSVIAISFLITSVLISLVWDKVPRDAHAWIVATFMCCLGLVACTLLLSFMEGGAWEGILIPVQDCFDRECEPHKHSSALFYVWLVLFGIASAGCFTPGTYLIGEYVDFLEDAAAKDAANAIWNTLWEVGGSVGLALGGIPSTRSWFQEQILLASMGIAVMAASVVFVIVSSCADKEEELHRIRSDRKVQSKSS
jgi:MFS family permease